MEGDATKVSAGTARLNDGALKDTAGGPVDGFIGELGGWGTALVFEETEEALANDLKL
jgi:hypothetical protein